MHHRQAFKVCNFDLLAEGKNDYSTFKAVASFGWLKPEDYQIIQTRSPTYNPFNSEKYSKDHKFSRAAMYSLSLRNVATSLMAQTVKTAMMLYASRYEIKIPKTKNEAIKRMIFLALCAGHPANAELLTSKANSKKGAACSHNESELAKKIIDWEI